ncbi:hypothetical protein [Pedobacter suwonensis]|uniref:hypothetical protein n=1 Tax=Pedobacter suwonensis TaxID=332999 RepID=UPI0011AA3D48|nr:hypothetical protein [Pedobacter suwonensis]
MKKLILLLSLSLTFCSSFGQQNIKEDEKISKSVMGFLKWYKSIGATGNQPPKQARPKYSIVKDIPINKNYKRQVIDKAGVEKYLDFYRKSGFLSEEYLNGLRSYFNGINNNLIKRAPIKKNDMIKIDGLDRDIQLQTFEPEIILDNLDKAVVTKSLVVYDKALISVNFYEEVNLIFTLTKHKDVWLIDYLGPDNTSLKSFFRQ